MEHETIYIFDFVAPGLNGKNGMKRAHWSKYAKLKEKIQWCILEQGVVQHEGQVRIEYKRVSSQLMDWCDNMPSSMKAFMDALADCGVIKGDSPKIIPFQPLLIQEVGKPRTEIKIFSIPGKTQ